MCSPLIRLFSPRYDSSSTPASNRKLKKPSFNFRKGKKESTITVESTIERAPETDPIMEDREDASEVTENTGLPSNERDTRESPADSEEKTPKDDESVATESKENREDFLSTVKEEPSKEAEEMAAEDATSHLGSVVQQKCMPSMDEDLTMDASATTNSGYHTPANSPSFCGCFAL